MFSRYLLLFFSLVLVSGLTRGIHASEPGALLNMSFDSRDQLNSSWTGGESLGCKDGIFELKDMSGRLKYHHQLKDFEISFDYQVNQSLGSRLIFILPPDKSLGKKQSKIVFKQNEISFPSKEKALQLKLGDQKGKWNRIVIRFNANGLTLNYNDSKMSSDIVSRKWGKIGFYWKNASKGIIRLRNIKLVETGFTSLFNGKDFSGWKGEGAPAERCWKVENGILHGLKSKGPYLRSENEYGDFRFRLEYKVEPGANSGVFIRVPANGNHHRKKKEEPGAGYEIQILDDTAEKYQNLREYQFGASLYDIMGVNKLVGKPVGEWNSMEIMCHQNRIVITHNGIKVVDANAKKYPLMHLRKKKGFLGLQNHGGGVAFRNIRIAPSKSIHP